MTDTPAPPPPPPDRGPTPAGAACGRGGYPLRLDLDAPLELARWRPLVHWLLIIPYAIVAGLIGYVVAAASFIAFFTILFTRKIPDGLFRFMAMGLRVQWRAQAYGMFMREPYPNWEFTPSSPDPGGDPATLSIDEPGELNRWLPLVKWLLAIPHYIVLFFLFIGVAVVELIAFFAVLITGAWPEGMRRYVIGVMRWTNRVGAYVYLMTDEYPPFSLD